MTLLDTVERLAAADRSQVVLDPERCVHALNTFSECSACVHVCPAEALTEGKPPGFDAKSCAGCLACLPACPVSAISADDAVSGLLTCAARLETPAVELVCKEHAAPRRGIAGDQVAIQVRGCLAGLGAGAYLSLAALGLRQVSVRLDACSACAWGALQSQIQAQLALAQQILAWRGVESNLQAILEPAEWVERPLWNADNPPLSRRDLFRFASLQGQIALARTLAKKPLIEGRRPSRDRHRMESALEHLPARLEEQSSSILESGFGYLQVNEDCTACGVCARACPTGALELEKEGQAYRLLFTAWKCTGCDFCLHVCAPHALQVDHHPSASQAFAAEPVVLIAGTLTVCERCRSLFSAKAGEKFCPTCAFRRKNPFGSRQTPGISVLKSNATQPKQDKGV